MSKKHLGVDPSEHRRWLAQQRPMGKGAQPRRARPARPTLQMPVPSIGEHHWAGRYRGCRLVAQRTGDAWLLSVADGALPDELAIGSEAALTGFRRLLAASDVKTGDPEFDDAVRIVGEPGHVLACATAGLRAALPRWVAGGLTVRAKVVELRREGLSVSTAARRVRAMVRLAKALHTPEAGVAVRLLRNAEQDPLPAVARRNLELVLDRLEFLHPNRRWRAVVRAASSGDAALGRAARRPLVDGLLGDRSIDALGEAALVVALGAADGALREAIIARLAVVGTEDAVAPLTELADAFFGRGAVKEAARDALRAIIGRLGALQAGRLALAEATEGGLSLEADGFEDDPDADLTGMDESD